MKWNRGFAMLALFSLSSYSSLPALATLLPAGSAVATGQGIHVTINVMSNNNTCTCQSCSH
jgi:hypothetical protein